MKYLAIMRDSLREALDSKILYATLIISVLVILLLASVSFQPLTVEEQFTNSFKVVNSLMKMNPHAGLTYGLEDYRETHPEAEPWQRDYEFVITVDFSNEDAAKQFKEMLSVSRFKHDMRQSLPWAQEVEVTDQPAKVGNQLRRLVQTKGSNITDRRGWIYEPALFFGALRMPWFQNTLGHLVEFITDDVIGSFGAGVTMLLSVIITAFFIPNMLQKGAIELLLAKPITRVTLVVYKFVGGLTFMFLNTAVIMGGVWLVLGLRTGLWVNGLLLCILIFTFQFAIFYAVSTLMAVVTRGPLVAILVCVVTWGFLFGFNLLYRWVDNVRPEKLADKPAAETMRLPTWVFPTVDVIHFVAPHYKDLDRLTTKLIRSDLIDHSSQQWKDVEKDVSSINWTESLSVTVAFIVLLLGLSCWRFGTRDF